MKNIKLVAVVLAMVFRAAGQDLASRADPPADAKRLTLTDREELELRRLWQPVEDVAKQLATIRDVLAKTELKAKKARADFDARLDAIQALRDCGSCKLAVAADNSLYLSGKPGEGGPSVDPKTTNAAKKDTQ